MPPSLSVTTSGEEAVKQHATTQPGTILLHTDGSDINGHAGAAAIAVTRQSAHLSLVQAGRLASLERDGTRCIGARVLVIGFPAQGREARTSKSRLDCAAGTSVA